MMAEPTLYLAVDPAIAKPCWIANCYKNISNGLFSQLLYHEVFLTNFESYITYTMRGASHSAYIDIKSIKIIAAIEKPNSAFAGTNYAKTSRPAANAIAAAIRRIAPRRNRIIFIDPQAWQREMLTGAPGKDTKERSCFVASEIAGREIINDNEADVVNIYQYAENHGWELA